MPNKTISISAPLNFDKTTPSIVQLSSPFGSDWPVVYIINNDQEAYVGETIDASARLSQHLDNPDRKRLHTVRLISGRSFNKSVALDLEAFLISHMAADNKFRLQNGNAGQQKHNYYQRSEYESHFEKVWQDLQCQRLANKNLREIENSNLFKYSPYKSLTQDQYTTIANIVQSFANNFQQDSIFFVNGAPGTGKTILGIYLLKLLSSKVDEGISDSDNLIQNLQRLQHQVSRLKIGMVISMSNLRNIVQEVFSTIDGLNSNMVYSPSQIAHSQATFDLLIVDEAHRLRRRKNLAQYSSHDKANRILGLGDEGTELDWILKKSKHCVFIIRSGLIN